MHCAVHLDIHIVADLVVAKVSCQVDVSFVPEWTREQVPGPRPQPVTSRHGCCVASSYSFVSSLAPVCSTTRERVPGTAAGYRVEERVPERNLRPLDMRSDGVTSIETLTRANSS